MKIIILKIMIIKILKTLLIAIMKKQYYVSIIIILIALNTIALKMMIAQKNIFLLKIKKNVLIIVLMMMNININMKIYVISNVHIIQLIQMIMSLYVNPV